MLVNNSRSTDCIKERKKLLLDTAKALDITQYNPATLLKKDADYKVLESNGVKYQFNLNNPYVLESNMIADHQQLRFWDYVEPIDVPKDFICSICLYPLNKGILHNSCGNHFCEECIREFRDQDNKAKVDCPLCKISIPKDEAMHRVGNVVQNQADLAKVICSHCERIMERGEIVSHIRQHCAFKCINFTCKKPMIGLDALTEHVKSNCQYTKVECNIESGGCGMWIGDRLDLDAHLKVCPGSQVRLLKIGLWRAELQLFSNLKHENIKYVAPDVVLEYLKDANESYSWCLATKIIYISSNHSMMKLFYVYDGTNIEVRINAQNENIVFKTAVMLNKVVTIDVYYRHVIERNFQNPTETTEVAISNEEKDYEWQICPPGWGFDEDDPRHNNNNNTNNINNNNIRNNNNNNTNNNNNNSERTSTMIPTNNNRIYADPPQRLSEILQQGSLSRRVATMYPSSYDQSSNNPSSSSSSSSSSIGASSDTLVELRGALFGIHGLTLAIVFQLQPIGITFDTIEVRLRSYTHVQLTECFKELSENCATIRSEAVASPWSSSVIRVLNDLCRVMYVFIDFCIRRSGPTHYAKWCVNNEILQRFMHVSDDMQNTVLVDLNLRPRSSLANNVFSLFGILQRMITTIRNAFDPEAVERPIVRRNVQPNFIFDSFIPTNNSSSGQINTAAAAAASNRINNITTAAESPVSTPPVLDFAPPIVPGLLQTSATPPIVVPALLLQTPVQPTRPGSLLAPGPRRRRKRTRSESN